MMHTPTHTITLVHSRLHAFRPYGTLASRQPLHMHLIAAEIGKALAEPTSDSIAILDQAVDTLQRYPQVHVTVAGYTDSVGTAAYNQSLSERRAQIVYDYLTSHGIDASRLSGPIGHGENDPIGDNSTDSGRAQNRRTELQVQQ